MNVSNSTVNAVQATRQPTQIQKAAAQRAQSAEVAPAPEAKKPETPVVNTRGETTGRLLNVKA